MFDIGIGHYLTLGAVIFTIGVAYNVQEFDAVPKESSDFQLDAVLTEKRVIQKEEQY